MNSKHYNPKVLADKRSQSGKSQQEIANELNVDRQTIYRVESGRTASFEIIAALCSLYKIPTSDVVYEYPIAEVA